MSVKTNLDIFSWEYESLSRNHRPSSDHSKSTREFHSSHRDDRPSSHRRNREFQSLSEEYGTHEMKNRSAFGDSESLSRNHRPSSDHSKSTREFHSSHRDHLPSSHRRNSEFQSLSEEYGTHEMKNRSAFGDSESLSRNHRPSSDHSKSTREFHSSHRDHLPSSHRRNREFQSFSEEYGTHEMKNRSAFGDSEVCTWQIIDL